MKKNIFCLFYIVILISFTVYLLLDTFVITRVYQVVPEEDQTKQPSTEVTAITDILQNDSNTYRDSNIQITITESRVKGTTVYVADVKVSSAEYLKTAFAKNSYGRNIKEKTSVIAQSNQAILAINGDFYGSRETGYVLRNGVLYRDIVTSNQEDLVIYKDGSFQVVEEREYSAEMLLNQGAMHIFSFGPAIVTNGEVSVSARDEVDQAMNSNPRTAMGYVDSLHYLFVVSDGRTNESKGLSLMELGSFMASLGCTTAYNLDGGGSSTMYFNGKIINNPTTTGRIQERSVSDIVYIGY